MTISSLRAFALAANDLASWPILERNYQCRHRQRLKPGAVVEVKTSGGLMYAMFTHRHEAPPRMGSLIRVFDSVHAQRPADLAPVIRGTVQLSTFFPVTQAVNKGLVECVGHFKIPAALREFPLFRSGTPDPETGKVKDWWFWDGTRSWKVGPLTTQQRKLPLLGAWNFAYLLSRLESRWRPETDAW